MIQFGRKQMRIIKASLQSPWSRNKNGIEEIGMTFDEKNKHSNSQHVVLLKSIAINNHNIKMRVRKSVDTIM